MQCCLTPLLEFTRSCFSTDNEVSLQAMGLEPESRHIVGNVFSVLYQAVAWLCALQEEVLLTNYLCRT